MSALRWTWCFWMVAAAAVCAPRAASADDVSAPAILQMFEARWTTIEDRMADIFDAGYGQMWLPPPQRADSGNLSVGYDLFDRFDLGKPRNETLYGTETSLKTNIAAAHRASVSVYTDFIPNHNGFTNLGTIDTRGTPSTADDVSVAQAGGYYPGFVLELPPGCANSNHCTDGDFHSGFASGDIQGRLAGLIDIAQEANHQFIRQPITAGNPQNIPAGTIAIFGRPPANLPDANNARFYPDQGQGGIVLNDPALGGNFTRYNFNQAAPLSGDPTSENATGLLMRNAQWMVEVIGVDGFRLDAVKHMEPWVMQYLDQAVFRANPRLQHDGSIKPAFMFGEVLDGNKGFVQQFIRKNLNPTAIDPSHTTVGGNRDALDFPLFFAMRGNLTGVTGNNNWHAIRFASQDTQDDGFRNGSQGVSFVDSHDNLGGGFPFLYKVAYAYTLMRPGNAIVYLNSREFGDDRDFPRDEENPLISPMSNDALGGLHGDAIPTLVEIRNSHGRGNFHERWIDNEPNPNGFSNIYIYERENSALVGLNSSLENDSAYDERSPVQTGFAPNSVLVELTGNANDLDVDWNSTIPETIRVNGSGQATLRIPRNKNSSGDIHGRGYVVYGVAPPRGTLSISNVSQVLQGATSTAANNGTARLADMDVITGNSFSVQLETDAVTLPAPFGESQPYRDFDADGNQAMIRFDGGMNLNNQPGIDVTNPSDISYGFENFTDTHLPGYGSATGDGLYIQNIDATQLAEGRHYVTVRAYRHRDSGPAVFTDFKKTVYIDRFAPEAEIASFDPFTSNPGNPNNRDMIVRSPDGTINNMHIYLDLPANFTDAQILNLVQQGVNHANDYDRDAFYLGFSGLSTGNHVATIVSYEPTSNYSIQRLPGLFTDTNIGVGFGDMVGTGYAVSDILCSGACNNNSVQDVLYSQNAKYRAPFDVDGNGLADNRDLYMLGDHLVANGASVAVRDAYVSLLLKRADVNLSGTTNSADIAALYASFGSPSWTMDLNVDGAVDIDDVETMITELFRTQPGDFNLDGNVDAADYVVWRKSDGSGDAMFIEGDADLDGDVDNGDFNVWRSHFGFVRPLSLGAVSAVGSAVPEPTTAILGTLALAFVFSINSRRANEQCMGLKF